MSEVAMESIERQEWLDPVATQLSSAVRAAYTSVGDAGQRLKNVAHGTWLGHPLHPVLTDIPIGAWMTAAVLDVTAECTGDRGYARAADVAIGFGLAGAVGAAATGLTDWSETDGAAKRSGLVHGLLNIAATTLYATALIMRRNGNRSTGQAVGLAGLTVASAASYLGGALVSRDRIGVSHADILDAAAVRPALEQASLQEGEKKKIDVEGGAVVAIRQHARTCGLAEHCSHLGGPLSEGTLEDGSIVCPWHGSRFALDDGRVIDGPATHPQPHFDIRETRAAMIDRHR